MSTWIILGDSQRIPIPRKFSRLPDSRANRSPIQSSCLPATFADAALERLQPLEYDRYHALAPGVVLIKAPGHTPGSQMVYVQRSDGAEVLFLGDVAWQFRNIETQRERPRLVTWFLLKEDRTAVFGQLAALKQLHESEPRVHIVPGHDAEVVSALLHAGVLKAHFDALAAPQT